MSEKSPQEMAKPKPKRKPRKKAKAERSEPKKPEPVIAEPATNEKAKEPKKPKKEEPKVVWEAKLNLRNPLALRKALEFVIESEDEADALQILEMIHPILSGHLSELDYEGQGWGEAGKSDFLRSLEHYVEAAARRFPA